MCDISRNRKIKEKVVKPLSGLRRPKIPFYEADRKNVRLSSKKKAPRLKKKSQGLSKERNVPGIKPERAYFISAESQKNLNSDCADVKFIDINLSEKICLIINCCIENI